MSQNTARSYTYLDCLKGRVPIPAEGKGRVAFQIAMVFCMVSCLVTLNWLVREPAPSLAAFAGILYEYPITFSIAVIVRLFVANPLVARIAPRIVPKTPEGIARTIVMTLINIVTMASIMTAFGIVISHGIGELSLASYATNLPLGYALAFTVNFFFAAPLVKTLFVRWAHPAREALRDIREGASRIAAGLIPSTLFGRGE